MPQFPSVTKTWHSKPYAAIDPSRPKLSAKGKVIAITGGAGTIGSATALAFAKAGATKIAVIGLGDDHLSETKKTVEDAVSGVEVFVCKGDLSEADSLRGAFGNVKQELGAIDILVANAAFLPKVETLQDADPEEWWKGFEVNTKGAFHCCRAFLPVAAPGAVLVDVSSGRVHLPALPTSSGYMASKLAATKIYETFGVENKNISVVHIHPGVIDSDLFQKTGQDTSFDDGTLLPVLTSC